MANIVKFYTVLIFCTILIFSMSGCTQKNENNSDLIHINVSAAYSEKVINLNEIAEIEFLQLEMHDDFLFRGLPRVITSDKIIFGEFSSGDILVFSRDGKPISRFNRRGGGPEEFPSLMRLVYDETTNEIFVQSPTRIMVYSLTGEFKRTIPLLEESSLGVLVSFNSEYLLLYDRNNIYPTPFSLISKNDGSVETVDMPNGNKIDDVVVFRSGERNITMLPPMHHIIWYNDGFLLNNYATDTIFFLSQNRVLSPFLIRTPELHSTNLITLSGFVEAGNYQFFQTTRHRIENRDGRYFLPETFLMRDKTTGSIYRQRIIFDDFRGREISISHATIANTQNSRIGLISLDLTELQDANDTGRLSGRLKEIVENSDEDGNNVFMLLHFK